VPIDENERISAADLAALLGLSERRLRDLAAAGILARAARGQYRFGASVRQYVAHLREIAAGRGSAAGDLDLVQERARLAKERADATAMKNAISRGELLPADEVERTWTALLREVRSGCLALPPRIGSRLGLDRAGVDIVREEVYGALDALSKEITDACDVAEDAAL
jgi:terminase small subunit / prophage DNA-packing protein